MCSWSSHSRGDDGQSKSNRILCEGNMCNKENKTVLAHRDLGKYIKEQFGEELSEDHNL